MPLLIIDGPEAVGKTTLISQCFADTSAFLHKWGPVDSLLDYYQPAINHSTSRDLHVWDRGWASESVYRGLLQDRDVSLAHLGVLEMLPNVSKLILVEHPEVLQTRRNERMSAGETDDLPVDPTEEQVAFMLYAQEYNWTLLNNGVDSRKTAEFTVDILEQIRHGR